MFPESFMWLSNVSTVVVREARINDRKIGVAGGGGFVTSHGATLNQPSLTKILLAQADGERSWNKQEENEGTRPWMKTGWASGPTMRSAGGPIEINITSQRGEGGNVRDYGSRDMPSTLCMQIRRSTRHMSEPCAAPSAVGWAGLGWRLLRR